MSSVSEIPELLDQVFRQTGGDTHLFVGEAGSQYGTNAQLPQKNSSRVIVLNFTELTVLRTSSQYLELGRSLSQLRREALPSLL